MLMQKPRREGKIDWLLLTWLIAVPVPYIMVVVLFSVFFGYVR